MSTPGTVLITGTTSGVGLNATCALVKRGWTVITANRSPQRAAAAADELDLPKERLKHVLMDLGDLDSVRRAVDSLPERLDAVVCNAAVHGCIADHSIQSLRQGIHRPAHTVEITQVHQNVLQPLFGKVQLVGSRRGPLRAAVRRDHRPTPLHQGAGGIQAHTGGGAGDQNGAGRGHQDRARKAASLPVSTQSQRRWSRISAPDHAQTVGGDPLILLADQTLLSTDAEQTIKTMLQRFQFRRLNRHDRRDFTVAIHAFLIGHGQTDQAHSAQQNKPRLGRQGEKAALQFLLVGLPLNRRSHAGCIRAGS